jgi:hypothetical protein
LKNSGNIKRDSVDHIILDLTKKDTVDTVHNNYYNDGIRYLTIYITKDNVLYEYTFHYYGTDEYWETSTESSISLVYAYDGKGNGGSEGNDGFKGELKLRKKLTSIFESEFITKVDKQLGKSHTESH